MSMRTDQQYRETKMRLLHKLLGIEWLRDVFDGIDCADRDSRDWFKGYFQYSDLNAILDRIAQGRPISCVASKENGRHFHVAFCSTSEGSLSYVTLVCQPATKFVEETGVHFCNFKIIHKEDTSDLDIKTVQKKEFKELVGDYALMLPYVKRMSASRRVSPWSTMTGMCWSAAIILLLSHQRVGPCLRPAHLLRSTRVMLMITLSKTNFTDCTANLF